MYNYEEERPSVFTEEGVKAILKMLDRLHKSSNGMMLYWDVVTGTASDSFQQIACVDYLKELHYINIGDVGKRTQDNIIVLRDRVYVDE